MIKKKGNFDTIHCNIYYKYYKTMKFSITTSFFNTGKYIDGVYNSITEQTYSNWEWIITDDWSSDDTKNKLIELSKKDKRVIYKEQDHKKEMFFNPQLFGDGDFIFQLDSDDLLIPKTLEIYLYFFTLLKDVTFIISCANQFEYPDKRSLFDIADINKIKNLADNNIIPFARCWRNKEILFEESKLFHNDYIQVTKLEENGKFLYIPRTLYKWNYRPGSISHSTYDIKELKSEQKRIDDNVKIRRNYKELNTQHGIFKGIDVNYYNTMQISNLNYEKECKYISIIKKDNYSSLEEKLKLLYYDHKVSINEYKDIDYHFTYIKNQDDYDFFIDFFKNKYENGEFTIKLHYKNDENIMEDLRGLDFGYSTFYQTVNDSNDTFIIINR